MLSIVGTYIESLMIGRGTPPPPCSLCSRFCRPLDSGLSGRVGLGARNEGWTEGERLKSGKTVLGEGGRTGLGGRRWTRKETASSWAWVGRVHEPLWFQKKSGFGGSFETLAQLSAFDYEMTLLMLIFLNNTYFWYWKPENTYCRIKKTYRKV